MGPAIHIVDADVNNGYGLSGKVSGLLVTLRGNRSIPELPKIEFEKIEVTNTVDVAFILK